MDSVVAPLPFSNQGLSIEDSGSMYVITTPAGLIIKWTHLTGIVDIHFGSQFNLSSYTEGLCGERCFSNICFFFFFFSVHITQLWPVILCFVWTEEMLLSVPPHVNTEGSNVFL